MQILTGDNQAVLQKLIRRGIQVDSVVTDPPYGLTADKRSYRRASPRASSRTKAAGFMGCEWDSAVPSVEFWRAVYAVLKPGGHVLSFGGTRTYHRMVCAIEDAGFEIRDQLSWMYGSGFPKSLNVSKAFDKLAGAQRKVLSTSHNGIAGGTGKHAGLTKAYGFKGEYDITAPQTDLAKQWAGFGTALKPAFEPIVLARKPLDGTVAANVAKHGAGVLNIEACRVGKNGGTSMVSRRAGASSKSVNAFGDGLNGKKSEANGLGRWPSNVLLDETAAEALDAQSGVLKSGGYPTRRHSDKFRSTYGKFSGGGDCVALRGADSGGASRFFYCAKASPKERAGSPHPTVKPIALMRYLCRLITPPGGLVLDPFAGSGTTGEAATLEGFESILIEREAAYLPSIKNRAQRTSQDLSIAA